MLLDKLLLPLSDKARLFVRHVSATLDSAKS